MTRRFSLEGFEAETDQRSEEQPFQRIAAPAIRRLSSPRSRSVFCEQAKQTTAFEAIRSVNERQESLAQPDSALYPEQKISPA